MGWRYDRSQSYVGDISYHRPSPCAPHCRTSACFSQWFPCWTCGGARRGNGTSQTNSLSHPVGLSGSLEQTDGNKNSLVTHSLCDGQLQNNGPVVMSHLHYILLMGRMGNSRSCSRYTCVRLATKISDLDVRFRL